MVFGTRSRGASLAAITVAGALSFSSSVGHAQSTSDDLARRHFDSGVAYLEESDYDSALTAFEKSYDLSKRPEILLNIATVQERRGELPAAVGALRAYLEAAPQGEHAETVKLRIQNLEKRIQEQNEAKVAASPPPPNPPTPGPVKAPPRSTVLPPPPQTEPNRLPAFISLGVGGLMAGGAVATGLIAKAKYDDAEATCHHTCRDDQLSGSRTFALTSTVLTGAAVLGVGLGVVLLFSSDGDAELARTTPRVDVTLTPSAAAASAAWRF